MNFVSATWEATGEASLCEPLQERGVAFLQVPPKSMLPLF